MVRKSNIYKLKPQTLEIKKAGLVDTKPDYDHGELKLINPNLEIFPGIYQVHMVLVHREIVSETDNLRDCPDQSWHPRMIRLLDRIFSTFRSRRRGIFLDSIPHIHYKLPIGLRLIPYHEESLKPKIVAFFYRHPVAPLFLKPSLLLLVAKLFVVFPLIPRPEKNIVQQLYIFAIAYPVYGTFAVFGNRLSV
jgi:hypothetical protein